MNPETRAQRPSLRTHTWGTNHFPTKPSRGGARRRPRPAIRSPRVRCPRVTSGHREELRAGRLPCFPGKLARASWSHAREGYSREWPDVLRPPPALPRGTGSKAAAARELQPKRPPLPQPPGRGRDRGRLHNIITRRLRFGSGAGSSAAPDIGEERRRPALPAASAASAHYLPGSVVFPSARPLRLRSRRAPVPPPQRGGPAPEAAGPRGGRRGRDPGASPVRAGCPRRGQSSRPAARGRVAPPCCAPRPARSQGPLGGPGSRGRGAPLRWPPEESRRSWSPPGALEPGGASRRETPCGRGSVPPPASSPSRSPLEAGRGRSLFTKLNAQASFCSRTY
ncbi:STE20-related kinase adapter protein beta isoform X3 [Vulpes lagopus]|uniref:STE20-related kinase adapter protein beta isoform X3 n=1 Tax=Vulpes lagopus TaxID=494514 RepID=UPI001BC9723C|nr:STE20-related kinase adapter protein beta isoform X3 [Vulpes lagopus]